MTNPTIDIAIPFNEIEFKDRARGFIKKAFKGKPISYIDQLIALKNSIDKNWPTMNGEVYALHSEHLCSEHVDVLSNKGIKVKHIPVEPRHGSNLLNKITAYSDFSNADFTLQLDADMLFLKPPKFDFSKDSQAGYESALGNTPPQMWKELFDHYDLNFSNINEHAYRLYQESGEHNFMPCINNGAVLVKNSHKQTFRDHVLEAENLIAKSKYFSNRVVQHFFMEIAASIAFHRTENKSYFARGINFLGSPGANPHRLPYNEDVSLYHYVGARTPEAERLFSEYFQVG